MSGGVELANLSFRYAHDAPWILDHINLKIRPGQYVAIVGKTGCGKSTLMRLLLGFETPVSGAVYYDNRDLQTLDLPALRRNIGVVLQQSRLFAGDIYSNIAISAPWLTMDEAWEAAKLAGMDEDIKKMPMGMYTLIGEGGGALSGGQRQRLMIDLPEYACASCVATNEPEKGRLAGRLLASELIRRKRRRVGFICNADVNFCARQRDLAAISTVREDFPQLEIDHQSRAGPSGNGDVPSKISARSAGRGA